ncbi:MAG: HAMP domain-containing histidine kinase [Candidatus Yanofskybacteria bacterium]|nr:HAMP domain-containing histidine kinase [Candidatus Yanofskybacteria bacterium]
MVWVTKLRDDPFIGPRIKFTLVNFLIIIISFTWGNIVLELGRTQALRQNIEGRFGNTALEQEVIQNVLTGLNKITLPLFLSVAVGISVVSYFLAGITLTPIKNIIRAQKRFIADASHELRTPLSIIKADSEIALLDGSEITPQEAVGTIKSNLEEVDRMSRIIDNLLSLSFYDASATEIPFQLIKLNELVGNLVQKAQSLARSKSVALTLGKADAVVMMGNPIALEQMTMNLIRNAILYTPEGGTVTASVVVKPRESTAEVIIQDTGIGISTQDLPHVMTAFYKSEQTKSKEGSGLGLAIVKKIVDRHQGHITIESQLAKGTKICVYLPTIKQPA